MSQEHNFLLPYFCHFIPSALAGSGDTLHTHAPEPHTLTGGQPPKFGTFHSSSSWKKKCLVYPHACSINNPSRETISMGTKHP